MVDGFTGLWHHCFIGSNNDDGNVCDACTTGTHGRKSFMTRRVKESNLFPVFTFNFVSSDMLSNSTCFAGYDIRTPDEIEQLGLSMVNVPHHRNDWRTVSHIFRLVRLILFDGFLNFNTYKLHLMTKFFSHEGQRFRVKTLIDGNKHSKRHAGGNDIGNRNIQHGGQFIGSDKLGDFDDPFAFFHSFLILMHLMADSITLSFTVFRCFRFSRRT